jgi:hypothetical protein
VCFLFSELTCKKEPPVVPPSPPPSGPDTTSHNFTFTQYTFGGTGGSSYFKDVAIINDTDIWAVGAIYTVADTAYNAAHWNGKQWELLQIQFYTFCGQAHTGAYPIDAILAFSGTEVWFASNSQMAIWKNNGQQSIMCLPASVYKIWAVNGNAVYTVGPIGEIDFYNGTTWTIQPSGTTIDLRDVWGMADGNVVWACGYSNDLSQSILLKYDGTSWKTLWSRQNGYTPPYGDLISSVWSSSSLYITSNYGIFRDKLSDGSHGEQLAPRLQYFPHCIRGVKENDIVEAGDNGEIWHYNGASWKQVNAPVATQVLNTVSIQSSIVVAGGTDFAVFPGQALIYFGKRNSQ